MAATTSVAVCTLNGAALLDEQLHSIASQAQLPDELVICDDGSTDGTVGILQGFVPEAPFRVRLYRNDRRLGYAKSVERAISLCTGDLISLTPQDTVWMPDRLQRCVAALDAHPLAGVVSSDAGVLKPEEREHVTLGEAHAVLLHRNFVNGAGVTFRSECRGDIVPIPALWAPDWWIALVVSLRWQVRLIDEPLLMDPPPPARLDPDPRHQAEQWEAALERIGLIGREGAINISVRDVAGLHARVRHLRSRATLPTGRLFRVPVVARELLNGGYLRYSQGVAAALRDLSLPFSAVGGWRAG